MKTCYFFKRKKGFSWWQWVLMAVGILVVSIIFIVNGHQHPNKNIGSEKYRISTLFCNGEPIIEKIMILLHRFSK